MIHIGVARLPHRLTWPAIVAEIALGLALTSRTKLLLVVLLIFPRGEDWECGPGERIGTSQ